MAEKMCYDAKREAEADRYASKNEESKFLEIVRQQTAAERWKMTDEIAKQTALAKREFERELARVKREYVVDWKAFEATFNAQSVDVKRMQDAVREMTAQVAEVNEREHVARTIAADAQETEILANKRLANADTFIADLAIGPFGPTVMTAPVASGS